MKPESRRVLIAAAGALLLLAAPAAAELNLLYDVDFATPPHTVANPPVTGAGDAPRKVPTNIMFGDPTVVAALGTLTEQPCAFGNGTTGYDQLRFAIAPSAGGFPTVYDEYWVSLVLLLDSYASGELFRILFDCPSVNNIEFHPDGSIQLYPSAGVIGNFSFGVPLLLDVRLDLVAAEWTIWLDGNHAHTGPLTDNELHTIRLNLQGAGAASAVGLDELRVYGGQLPPGVRLLYDVDFASPPHYPGAFPVLGAAPAPRKTPTDITFGDPTVVSALGSLIEQPCAFGNGTTGYDQLKFQVDPGQPQGFPTAYDNYELSLQVLVEYFTSGDQVVIFMDCPTVHRVTFEAGGAISVFPGGGTIGNYTLGVPVDLRIAVDVANDQWAVWLDGSPVFSGPGTIEMLRAVRVHMSGNDAANMAAVDDLRLWGWGGVSAIGQPAVTHLNAGLRAYPNPTANGSWIEWEAPVQTSVRVEILTVDGRRVWSRPAYTGLAGTGRIHWSGKNDRGVRLPAGKYFARLRTGAQVLGSRAVVLR